MKVVHVVEAFSTGIFDFLVELTNNLPESELIIIHGKREETPEDFERSFPINTQFIHWQNASRELSLSKDFLALKELFTIFRALNNIGAIHLHSSKAGFLGRIVTRALGYQHKVIYTPHAVSFLRKDVTFLKNRLFVLLESLSARLSGVVVACSKSEAEEFTKVGIQALFVNNGMVSKKLPLPEAHESLIIATIGRISFQKNPALFNEIATYFLNRSNVKFVWIGEGELSHLLVAKNITISGWLEKEEVLRCVNNTDIYLSTSLWEGLPISVLQAMSAKKPVVLSNCIGNKDLVRGNGFLFDGKDNAIQLIDLLLNDAEQRHAFGKISEQLVQDNFSVEQMVAGYWQLYLTCQKIEGE